jgi:glutathione peroxidase
MSPLYDLSAQLITGEARPLVEYRGRALLIVNTASACGFTPQYSGLEALHQHYEERGLSVLGFPCDQFGHQEPGDEEEIMSFCALNFGVTFQLFAKVEVNGEGAHPLFQWLKREAPGLLGSQAIKWNFTKFLVDREGKAVKRFAPTTRPEALEAEVARLLGA